jgi:hypothetical protein
MRERETKSKAGLENINENEYRHRYWDSGKESIRVEEAK